MKIGRPCRTPVASLVNDGTGIQMGLAAGGTTYMMGVAPMIHILQVPNLIKNDDLTADQKAILSALALVKGETSVTVNGEALDPTLSEAMIPEYKYYNVYTAEQIEAYKNEGLSENFATATSMFLGQGGSFEVGQPIADLDTILEVGQQYKNVLKADSIQSLAEQIGCDANVLAETLGGEDTTYYAVIVSGYTYGTVGGLDVDVNHECAARRRHADCEPVRSGHRFDGRRKHRRQAVHPMGGQAQSWTFVSGYLGGKAAAEVGMAE